MSIPSTGVNENSDEFHDVELAAANSSGPSFFIDKSTFNNVLQTIGVLILFIIVHIFAAWRAPGIISFDKQYYQLNQTDPNTSIDIDVTLATLQDLHRFVHVNGSLVRNTSIDATREIAVEVSSRLIYSKNNSIVNSESIDKTTIKLQFEAGSDRSSVFPVVHRDVNLYDTLQVKMTMLADMSQISGFYFTWSFGNPSGIKYSHSARVLMSFLIGYMLIIFFNSLSFDNEFFTQVFCIVVGIAGIFSSNPLAILYPASRLCRIADQILLAAFIAIFRLFIFCQFEMIRTKKLAPSLVTASMFGIYLGIHATIDATAGFDRLSFSSLSIQINKIVLPTEKYQMAADVIYAALSIGMIVLAFTQSNGYSARRLMYFSLINGLLILSSLFSHFFCVITGALMFTILPTMSHISIYMTTTAFSIFMLHNGGGPEYTQMGGDKDAGVLDVEQMSDDDMDDELDDEEEDGEEEEEEEE